MEQEQRAELERALLGRVLKSLLGRLMSLQLIGPKDDTKVDAKHMKDCRMNADRNDRVRSLQGPSSQ